MTTIPKIAQKMYDAAYEHARRNKHKYPDSDGVPESLAEDLLEVKDFSDAIHAMVDNCKSLMRGMDMAALTTAIGVQAWENYDPKRPNLTITITHE